MLDQVWTRRAFLRTSLIGPSAVLALLDRGELLARELPGELSLYNTYSDEWLEVCDRDPAVRDDRRALAALTRRDPPPQQPEQDADPPPGALLRDHQGRQRGS